MAWTTNFKYNNRAMPKKSNRKKVMRPVIEEIIEDKPQDSALHESKLVEEAIKPPENIEVVEEIPEPVAKVREVKKSDNPKDGGFRISIGFVFLTIIVAIFVAILAGGVYVYFNGVSSLKSVNPESPLQPTLELVEATPEPSEKPIATASPTPEPKLTTYKVNVLNGSGKIGEAGKVKILVEKAGFKVASTGNAADFSFKKTVVQVKQTVGKLAVASLKDSLKDSYELEDGDALEAKNTYDIIITVGAE